MFIQCTMLHEPEVFGTILVGKSSYHHMKFGKF